MLPLWLYFTVTGGRYRFELIPSRVRSVSLGNSLLDLDGVEEVELAGVGVLIAVLGIVLSQYCCAKKSVC